MTWLGSAEFLAQHPMELSLALSLLLSLTVTLAIRATERARPWLRAGFQRRPKFLGERSQAVFERLDEAMVLLALSLLAVFGGSSLFLHLVEALREGTWLPQWDKTFVQTVHQAATPFEVGFFSAITPLAGRYPPVVLGGLMAGLLLARKHYKLASVWIVGLIGNGVLIEGLKRVFQRQRPTFDQPLLVETNFSFPSGHAMTSILLYGLLAYVASREFFKYRPLHRHIMVWAITFAGVLIGTSRLVLGVHYPSDVMAGWSVGAIWLAILVLLAEALRGRFGPVERLWAYLRPSKPLEMSEPTAVPQPSM